MRKINNKGFTLVEVIAVIVLLALVISLGAFSITALINNSKEKNYELLISNIKSAAELYYQECKYGNTDENGACILIGDIYQDGIISSKDVTGYSQFINNESIRSEYSQLYINTYIDVDGSGSVDETDKNHIKDYVINRSDLLKIGTFPSKSIIKLGHLVDNGFLKGNASTTDDDSNKVDDLGLVNPKDDQNIRDCYISIEYNSSTGKVDVLAVEPTGSCPTGY